MTGIELFFLLVFVALMFGAVGYIWGLDDGWKAAGKSHMSWRKDRAEMDLLSFKSGNIGDVLEDRVKSHNPTTLDELRAITEEMSER